VPWRHPTTSPGLDVSQQLIGRYCPALLRVLLPAPDAFQHIQPVDDLFHVGCIRQALDGLPAGPHKTEIPLALRPAPGEAYARVEGPRGELGFYVVSDGGPAPFRFHIRAPSLINLSLLRQMAVGASLPDAIVTLGSADIVVGEIDR
jgi:Ni,Fe-hydrogenase III large subunit